MPSMNTVVLAVAALASSAAAGTAYIQNACSYNINIYTVGGDSPSATTTLAPGGLFSQPISGTGASLQVSKDGVAGDNELDYSLTDNLYYSVGVGGADFGPFADDGLSVVPSDTSCPTIDCPAGQFGNCVRQTEACPPAGNTDLTLTLCQG